MPPIFLPLSTVNRSHKHNQPQQTNLLFLILSVVYVMSKRECLVLFFDNFSSSIRFVSNCLVQECRQPEQEKERKKREIPKRVTMPYQQLPIASEDQVKMTFTWRGRRLMWKQWSFGLKPATGKFQRVLEFVLEGTEYFVCSFVDDMNKKAEKYSSICIE